MYSIIYRGNIYVTIYFNLIYFDSIIGIVGGILILKWATGLLKDTIKILIDLR